MIVSVGAPSLSQGSQLPTITRKMRTLRNVVETDISSENLRCFRRPRSCHCPWPPKIFTDKASCLPLTAATLYDKESSAINSGSSLARRLSTNSSLDCCPDFQVFVVLRIKVRAPSSGQSIGFPDPHCFGREAVRLFSLTSASCTLCLNYLTANLRV